MGMQKREAFLRARRAFPVQGLAQRVADFHWLNLVLALSYVVIPAIGVRDTVNLAAVQLVYAGFILLLHYRSAKRTTSVWNLTVDTWVMIAYIAFMTWQCGENGGALRSLYLIPTVITATGHTRRRAMFNVLLMWAVMLALEWRELAGLDTGAIVTLAESVIFGFLLIMVTALVGGFRFDSLRASGQLRQLRDRDELTGLLHLTAFNRLASRLYQAMRHSGGPMSVMVVDIQGLKSINDTHGLEVGNRVIQAVAAIVARMVRDTDLAARYSGDEFILMLPGADRVKAEEIGQRIRSGVAQATTEPAAKVKRMGVSIGVATYPRDGEALSELIQMAAQAMHRDKEARRPAAV
ncbi:MAG: GGDEF domain-containing protein [Gammaproteobacteria bacterium]|jgi:diguanylate cyclase (GGDEF)-like protein|nr:GGDEF domain-containing protein [Gammaproteobacteria bacterium]